MSLELIRAIVNSGSSLDPRVGDDISRKEKQDMLKMLRESANRSCEALRLYRPLPFQEAFHKANYKEVVLQKGNRAGGAQPLNGLVLTPFGWERMGDLEVGSVVISGDGSKCEVTHIHERGWMPIYRITFDDGATAVCTGDHLWRCKLTKTERFPSHPNYSSSKWGVRSLDQIRVFGGDSPEPRDRALIPTACVKFPPRPAPIDPYTLGVILGDGCISQDSVSFTTEDDEIAENVSNSLENGVVTKRAQKADTKARVYGVVALHNPTTGKPSPIISALRELGLMGLLGHEKFIPEDYLFNVVENRLAILRGLMDTDGYCDKKGNCYFYSNSPELCRGVVSLVRSLGGKSVLRWKETSIIERTKRRGRPKVAHPGTRKRCLNMGVVWLDIDWASPFLLKRKTARWESRKRLSPTFGRFIESIEPCGNAPCRCITVDHPDGTYVMENYVVTHNSLAGFVEDARAVCGKDPYGKYPLRDGTCCCLGFGEKHIGRVIHKLLFRAGSFRIIRDEDTSEWRVYRPWSKDKGGDSHREDESKPAPPLIPPRFIEEITWEKRSDRVFNICRLTTGWELFALNSNGDPSQAQGFDVNLYHIDEDTAQPGWYEEAIGRTAMTRGFIRWTALPHAKNDDMMNMIHRAKIQMEEPESERTTLLLRASMFDNPYYPEESKEANIKLWRDQGEDVLKKRAYGELTMDSVLMYPSFDRYIHNAINETDNAHRVQKILTGTNGTPPENWCLDMIVDPGHTVCAVLFIATPPPELGDFHIAYDELYIHRCDASQFGIETAAKVGQSTFQRFIIDAHGGELTSIVSGISPRRQYEHELSTRKVRCEQTGSRFLAGSDDVQGREICVRAWLSIRREGYPIFLVNVDRCPNLVREMERFKKLQQLVNGQKVTVDKGNRKANTHLVECLEYAAAHGLPYVKPKVRSKAQSFVQRVLADRERRKKQRLASISGDGGDYISLGPRGV